MANLELKLNTPIEELVPQMIAFNSDELAAEISAKLAYYKNAVYTDETIKQAKDDRAALNKLRIALDDERKSIARVYDAPLKHFTAEVNKIIAIIADATDGIDKQVKGFEARQKEARRAALQAHWAEIAADLIESIPYERVEQSTWLNQSTKEAKAKAEMELTAENIRQDLTTIASISGDNVDRLRFFYLKTLSLQKTLQENERLKAENAEIERLKAEREARERQAEEERQAAQKAREDAERAAQANAPTAPETPAEFTPPEIPAPEEEQPKLYTVNFSATGTLEQIKALKRFIAENGIKISKI